MSRQQPLPEEIEEHRDAHWLRSEPLRVETVEQAERFINEVGFAACMTDRRRPGPSLFIAVCGRRDAVMPRNVQKDETGCFNDCTLPGCAAEQRLVRRPSANRPPEKWLCTTTRETI